MLFSCCSSIWMSVSLARSSSLAACSPARTSALSPLPLPPVPFLDMVRVAEGRLSGWAVHTRPGRGRLAAALLHLLTHLQGKHTW